MQFTNGFTYKLHKPLTHFVSCLLFLWPAKNGYTQIKKLNAYGLHVISTPGEFRKIVGANDSLQMIDLKKQIPTVVMDLKYSDSTNFMKQRLYPKGTGTTYLRMTAAKALAAIQEKLKEKNLGIKIWDAYRPYSVTVKMWEPVKDDRYAANPKSGSGHNRGAAIDLTLVDLTTGKELDMGTAFDHFSDTAHVNFKNLPAEILANRRLLQSVMESHGFKVLDTEWWHFYLPDAKRYDLLDLSFKQLKKLSKHYTD
jgi:D-alanyl-D-alanine dipeptidase